MISGPNTLTILICTHNRVDLLLRTLEHLNAARRPERWQVDILVAANACSDATVTQLERFKQSTPQALALDWFEEPTPGKSHALNSAIPRIQSDLVAFVDDDHRVDSAYLVNLCRATERYPDADLFCGRILPDWDGSEPGWVHDKGPYRIYPLPVPRFDQGDTSRPLGLDSAIPGGGNLFLRREWCERVGGFSTEFGPVGHNLGGAEDLEWVRRALHLGARLQYVPDVVQYHYVDGERLALAYLIKKAYIRSASNVRLSEDGSTSGGRVPAFMYRKVAGYLLSVLTAIRAQHRRFYLVRLAAAMGECRGYHLRHKDRLQGRSLTRSGKH